MGPTPCDAHDACGELCHTPRVYTGVSHTQRESVGRRLREGEEKTMSKKDQLLTVIEEEEHLLTDFHQERISDLWRTIDTLRVEIAGASQTPTQKVSLLEKMVKIHKEIIHLERLVQGVQEAKPLGLIGVIEVPSKETQGSWAESAKAEVQGAKLLEMPQEGDPP